MSSPAMAAMQRSQHLSGGGIGRSIVEMEPAKDPFPAGLRVLVVDDDPIWLLILEKMLRCCLYEVTTCGEATGALAMLRQNKNQFDLVISDVYMPDMDGFSLLELVGLEMDLPVIMMSIDGETSAVMKGITHGACDYLLKPVRMEALRNIWQHVIRKRRHEVKDRERSGSAEDNERIKHPVEDKEHTCTSTSKKRKDVKEEEDDDGDDDDDHAADDPTALKKPRVVWSVELHQQFVIAVNQLGIDKAVPKRILELMGVQGLTRENVASHLQKYRLYLKRLSVGPYQNTGNMPFAGVHEIIHPVSSLDGINNMNSIGSCGQLPPQSLASIRSGILRTLGSVNGLRSGPVDFSSRQQVAALQGSNYGSFGRERLQMPWLNSQGNSFQALPGALALDHLAQKQPLAAYQIGPSVADLAGPNPLQHQITSTGLGGMGTTVPSSTALIMQLFQQQQHSQSRIVASTNLPACAFSGRTILSSEANQHLVQLPSTNLCFNDQVRNFGPTSITGNPNGCSGGRVPSASNVLSSLVTIPSNDDQLLRVAGADFQNVNGRDENSLASSSCMSGAAKELGVHFVKANEKYDPEFVREPMLKFSAIENVFRNGPGSSEKRSTGWHDQNVSAVQDLIKASHHLESPVYGQTTNANANTSFVFGQAHGECVDLAGAGSEFSKKTVNVESSHFRPSGRRSCTEREHSTAESTHNLKEGWMSGYEINKIASAGSNLKDASSDDLVALILKQQQQMTGFSGTEVVLDGYAPEICM